VPTLHRYRSTYYLNRLRQRVCSVRATALLEGTFTVRGGS